MAEKKNTSITVDGKSYAVGLFWYPLQSTSNLKSEIKHVKKIVQDADLFCVKKGAAPQAGLGFSKEGHFINQPVAASSVATAFKDKTSFIGVFKVKEGWWMIAVRNDLILPEKDTLFGTEEEAKASFQKEMSLPDWGYKVVPEGWEIEDSVHANLEDILKKISPLKLKKISFKNHFLRISIITILILTGLWFAYQKFIVERMKAREAKWQQQTQKSKEQKNKLEEEKKKKQLELEEKKKKQEQQLIKKQYPWNNLNDSILMAEACYNTIVNMTAIIPGWFLNDAVCNHNRTVGYWGKKDHGDIQSFEYGKNINPSLENVDFKLDTNLADIVGKTNFNITKFSDPPIYNEKYVLEKLTYIFQNNLETQPLISLKEDSVTVKSNNETVKEPYLYAYFKFTSLTDPKVWADILNKQLTSVEFISIKWDNNTKRWKYEGKIYIKK